MAKWCDEGENWLLDVAFKKNTSPPTNLYLGLYTNSTEPAETATLASLTEPSGAVMPASPSLAGVIGP